MKKINKKNRIQLFTFVVVFFIILSIGYAILTVTVLRQKKISRNNYIIDNNQGNTTDDNNKNSSQDNKHHHSNNCNDLDVKFVNSNNSPKIINGTGSASISNDTEAIFNVSNLSNTKDLAAVRYTIKNESDECSANLKVKIANSNQEYYNVTYKLVKNDLQKNETTDITIYVKLNKTPITKTESTSVIATITAKAIEK